MNLGFKQRIALLLKRNLDDFKLHQAVKLLNAEFNLGFSPDNQKALDSFLTGKLNQMGYGVSHLTKQPIIKSPKAKQAKKKKITNGLKKLKSDKFLNSHEWAKVRYKVLVKYGAICQCCGASKESGRVMNVDHIKPRKTHPHLALDENNLQVLCSTCNKGKSNWDSTDWRPT